MKKVLFIGLGHLGSFFSQVVPDQWDVSGTYRSSLDQDSFDNFKTYHFDSSDFDSFPFPKSFDFVIWSLPPFDEYTDILEKANNYLNKDAVWIYVGSTGVYSEGYITEKSPLSRKTARQLRMARIEDKLLTFTRNTFIVRPSGLVDEKRNPAKWFASRSEVKLSENRVNLVYTKDVARFIVYIIESSVEASDFNLSASKHPVKSQLYAEFLGEDKWRTISLDGKKENEKIIDNSKSKSIGFKYLVDDDLLKVIK